MRVIPSWQQWASTARIKSAYQEFPQDESFVPEGGLSILVVPTLDGFRLARAARFNLWQNSAQDFDAPVEVAEPDTYQPFLVRIPFKTLGRDPYLQHQDWFDTVEPLDLPHVVRLLPYKPLGRNPYVWNTAQDFDIPPAPQEDTLAPHWVRLQFRTLGRNPYLWHLDYESIPAAPAEPDTWVPYLVRLPIRGALRVVPAYVFVTPQDEDAPVVVVTGSNQRYFHRIRCCR